MQKMVRKWQAVKGRILLVLIIAVLGIITWKVLLPLYRFTNTNALGISFSYNLLFAKTLPLKATDDRTNVLLLGIGGEDHQAGDLTDTMLVYSFNQRTNKSYVLAIPRDIWSETLQDKVNTAYHYGEEKKKGRGLLLAKATVEEIIGVPIHYAYLIDFRGFETIIDVLGGVDVTVDRTFDDFRYPIAGREDDDCNGDPNFACRYENIHFEKGLQHMDGKTALKFARSRFAEGEEGSDFARSKRQEKVLEAVKNKLLNIRTYTSFSLVASLVDQFKVATYTDTNLGTTFYIGRLFLRIKDRKTISIEDQLMQPPTWQYDNRWVLIPKEGWDNFRSFIAKSLTE